MNATTTNTESWFIPLDIIRMVFNSVAITLCILCLFLIALDKKCHTVAMMITANSCLGASGCASALLSLCIFTFQNDLKQIYFPDSFCVIRAYFNWVSGSWFNYSFFIEAIYRYVIVIYPTCLFYQSARFQALIIGISWIFGFLYPLAFMFTDEIVYNVDNQICQLPFRLSFSVLYAAVCGYMIPVTGIGLIYLKLVRYVRQKSKQTTSVNIIYRAKRELKMVRRIVMLVAILLTLGIPYLIFMFMSFFTKPPKYHFRIAYFFVDSSLAFVMIALFQFNDTLKASLMKIINKKSNMVAPTIT
jgi:hypothetical protein